MANWETLFEGEWTASQNSNGYFVKATDFPVDPTYQYRLTFDGDTRIYSAFSFGDFYYAGNSYLDGGAGVDDGFGFCLRTLGGFAHSAWLRDAEPHTIKVERRVAVISNPDPLSLVKGYRVGCAIRANRGE